ncbi:MAG: Sensor protein [Myxococcales bacterium]|nr:Sensor protein [Myxococcales bacterium]
MLAPVTTRKIPVVARCIGVAASAENPTSYTRQMEWQFKRPDVRSVLRVWPALVALAVVVLLSITTLAIDMRVDEDTTARTTELVEDSLRSIALADELRHQAYRLSRANAAADDIADIRNRITLAERAYGPIATGLDESVQFARLQALLADLQNDVSQLSPEARSDRLATIEPVIQRLVEINQNDARIAEHRIALVHQRGLIANVVDIVVIVALAIAIAIALRRATKRQRSLLAIHLASLDERAKELEAFAARTAHDLKGPLTPIVMGAEFLNEAKEPRVRTIGARIRRSAERLSGIIDDLLALSVAGHPQPGHVRVAPVIAEVIDDLAPALADADVSVHVDDVTAACSTGVLGQLLRNVVTNSSKYRSPERKLALQIEAHAAGDLTEISVIDNGVGMDPHAVAQATQPYFRAVNASGTGHGLGLSIVKRTLESIGGTLELASKAGEGTRITMRVPQV